MEQKNIEVFVAGPEHEVYVDTILQTIADAAKVRGTGIAKRTHEYLATKMKEAKAVIALSGDRFAGFTRFPSGHVMDLTLPSLLHLLRPVLSAGMTLHSGSCPLLELLSLCHE